MGTTKEDVLAEVARQFEGHEHFKSMFVQQNKENLGIWDELTRAKIRIKELEDSIRNLHQVRGRFHTQQACERLYKLIGIEV
jgi:hypothetical protein